MFYATFVDTSSGVSKKTGAPWFRAKLLSEVGNETIIVDKFVVEDVYKQLVAIPKMTKIIVKMALNARGDWEICAIRKENENG